MLVSLSTTSKSNVHLWTKAKNLFTLHHKGFNIPKSIILDKRVSKEELDFLYKEYISSDIYIIRSSANIEDGKNDSFAGIFDSIEGFYELWYMYDDYLQVLKWIDSDSFLTYTKIKNIDAKWTCINIIVQEYIKWDYSWIYFSNFEWNKYLEFIKGWNALLVEGRVNPNSVRIGADFNILECNIQPQDIYLDSNLDIIKYNRKDSYFMKYLSSDLFNILHKIEGVFRFPVDVEWTIMDKKIYILQVRPITF